MGKHIDRGRFGPGNGTREVAPAGRKCRCLNKMDGLFFALMLLKLWGVVDWSWLVVTAPVWIPVCFAAIVLIGKVGYEMAKQGPGVRDD